jgi:hypothetical protein
MKQHTVFLTENMDLQLWKQNALHKAHVFNTNSQEIRHSNLLNFRLWPLIFDKKKYKIFIYIELWILTSLV